MNDKTRPAMMGGIALGLLSAIPFIGAVNACCCAWAILGGLLASYLYIKGSPTPVRPGDGAVVGAIAGVIGAAIYIVIGTPLSIATGNATMGLIQNMMQNVNPEAAEQFRQQAAMVQNMSFGEKLMASLPGALFGAVLLVIFATIGGLIGVPVFEKRKDGGAGVPPPPPPPDFGNMNQPGAGGGSFGSGT